MRIPFNPRGFGTSASLCIAALIACSQSESSAAPPEAPQTPPPGAQPPVQTPPSQGRIIGDDWKGYQTEAQLKSASLFWWFDSRDVYSFVDLVTDPTFGQVVRITFPQNSGALGPVPRMKKGLPQPLDDMWYRWTMKYEPGWTTVGPDPAGHANSYKIAFWTWNTWNGRGEVELSNTSQYITGMGVVDSQGNQQRYTTQMLPGSAPNFGRITTEWSDNEWWEFVVHYEKKTNTSADNSFWRRRLTTNGAIAPGPWTFVGWNASGATVPSVAAVELGANKNKNNPTDMYIYWGPWEVVDGSKSANPFNVPNVN